MSIILAEGFGNLFYSQDSNVLYGLGSTAGSTIMKSMTMPIPNTSYRYGIGRSQYHSSGNVFPYMSNSYGSAYCVPIGTVEDIWNSGGIVISFNAGYFTPYDTYPTNNRMFFSDRYGNSQSFASIPISIVSPNLLGSTDGITYEKSEGTLSYSFRTTDKVGTPTKLFAENGKYVVYGKDAPSSSANPITIYNAGGDFYDVNQWNSSPIPMFDPLGTRQEPVLYAYNAITGLWVATGTVSATERGILTTDDITSGAWTVRLSETVSSTVISTASGYGFRDVQYFPEKDIWIAVGYHPTNVNYGTIYTSTDGITWTRTAESTVLCDGVAYGNDIFVVMNSTSSIMTSTDGFTWVNRQITGITRPTDLVFANGKFFIYTYQPTRSIWTSEDGLSWSQSFSLTEYIGANFAATGRLLFDQGFVYFTNTNGIFTLRTTNGDNWECIANCYANTYAGCAPCGIFLGDAVSNGLIPTYRGMFGIDQIGATIQYVSTTRGDTTTFSGVTVGEYPVNTLHHCEIIFKSGSSAGAFDISMSVNGTEISSRFGVSAFASNKIMYFTMSTGGFNLMSDLLITNFQEPMAGSQGGAKIITRRFDTDVQAQWKKQPPESTETNAELASVPSPDGYVYSDAIGQVDRYSSNNTVTIPAGYKIASLKTEGIFTRRGIPTPTVDLSVHSGASTETSTVVLDGDTGSSKKVSIIQNTQPGGTAWDAATVNATEVSIDRSA